MAIISVDELYAKLKDKAVKIIDASWVFPGQDRDADQEWQGERIPGALRFDIDEIADRTSPLPHMLPSPQDFAQAMADRGISLEDEIIFYDSTGLFLAAARGWWMAQYFGFKNAKVLDGGLPQWKAQGHETYGKNDPLPQPSSVPPAKLSPDPTQALSGDDVHDLVKAGQGSCLYDARAPDRFSGQTAEPRPGSRAGHIPGANNLHFIEFLDDQNLQFKPHAALQKRIEEAGIEPDQDIVTSCGSGVTACVLALARAVLGHTGKTRLYDASWSEWGMRDDLPIEKAAPPPSSTNKSR